MEVFEISRVDFAVLMCLVRIAHGKEEGSKGKMVALDQGIRDITENNNLQECRALADFLLGFTYRELTTAYMQTRASEAAYYVVDVDMGKVSCVEYTEILCTS